MMYESQRGREILITKHEMMIYDENDHDMTDTKIQSSREALVSDPRDQRESRETIVPTVSIDLETTSGRATDTIAIDPSEQSERLIGLSTENDMIERSGPQTR